MIRWDSSTHLNWILVSNNNSFTLTPRVGTTEGLPRTKECSWARKRKCELGGLSGVDSNFVMFCNVSFFFLGFRGSSFASNWRLENLLLKYHHTAQMRDKRQSQKGQASMKLCGNDGFNNIVIIWRHQLAGYKCFVLVKTFSVQLRKLQFSSFQSTRASYNTLQQEMRDRNSYRVSKWANETII